MLGALFNRSQQEASSSTGGQNVTTSLKTFIFGGGPVGYSEFLGMGEPTTKYGYEGDIYVDLTPNAMSLYGHDGNKWIQWSGPSSNPHFAHPKATNRWLWCNGQRFGWLPISGRATYAQEYRLAFKESAILPVAPDSDPLYLKEDAERIPAGHTQSELLTLAIAKANEAPKKRKSIDAGPTYDKVAPKKRKAEVRADSTAADSASHRSLSLSVGPAPPVTLSPTLPASNGTVRSPSFAEPTNANSFSAPLPLYPEERANLLREIHDLRVASSLAQRQLAGANDQISQLQAENEALRRELATALSRILTDVGIAIPAPKDITAFDAARQPTPPRQAFSADKHPALPSDGRIKPHNCVSSAPAAASAGVNGPDVIEQRAWLGKSNALIAAAHSQLDELDADDGAEWSRQFEDNGDDDPVGSKNQTRFVEDADENLSKSGDPEPEGQFTEIGEEGEGEELAQSDDGELAQDPVENYDGLAGAGTVKEQHPADPPDNEDDYFETHGETRPNGHLDLDEGLDDMRDDGDGQELDLNKVDLSGQWNVIDEPAPEDDDEEGSSDTELEEDQLLNFSQADHDPPPEDDRSSASVAPEIVDFFAPGDVSTVREKDGHDDNNCADVSELFAAPDGPGLGATGIVGHKDDSNTREERSTIVVEQVSEHETEDLDDNKSDMPQYGIDNEESGHLAPVNGPDVTSPPSYGKTVDNDPGTSARQQSMHQESKAVDDTKASTSISDNSQVFSDSAMQHNKKDSPPHLTRSSEGQSQPETSRSVTLSETPTWISRIPLPILFAKTKRHQLCRFCLTETPQVITKFPLLLDLPAMEAHCNEKHEEYCAILLDMSPQDLQGLLDAEASA